MFMLYTIKIGIQYQHVKIELASDWHDVYIKMWEMETSNIQSPNGSSFGYRYVRFGMEPWCPPVTY